MKKFKTASSFFTQKKIILSFSLFQVARNLMVNISSYIFSSIRNFCHVHNCLFAYEVSIPVTRFVKFLMSWLFYHKRLFLLGKFAIFLERLVFHTLRHDEYIVIIDTWKASLLLVKEQWRHLYIRYVIHRNWLGTEFWLFKSP